MDLKKFIALALEEDVREGDHTTLSCIPADSISKAHLLVKAPGILAGVEIAQQIFHVVDPEIKMDISIKDGDYVEPGDIAFVIEGKDQSILKAERLILNIMQRMSGIATKTNKFVKLLKGLETQVLDTRKTTPNFRFFEKAAVKIGGGENHRMGLYDMIMIKDNHVDYAGGIEEAITATNNYLEENDLDLKVEIEVRNFEELESVLSIGMIDRVMLDNFSVIDTKEAVSLIAGRFETEASGGINFKTIRAYAETGVDYISVGALTHSYQSLDLSLKAID